MKKSERPQSSRQTSDICSTIGKHSRKYSFPKASRFKPIKLEWVADYVNAPSSLISKKISFGIGSRPDLKNPRGRDSPPPNSYDLPSSFSSFRQQVLSYGQPKESGRPTRSSTPGPGAYEPYKALGHSANKYSFGSRSPVIKKFQVPPPNSYSPNFNLVFAKNFSEIGFGVGRRSSLSSRESSPGPGSYDVRDAFAKNSFCYSPKFPLSAR